MIKYFYRTMHQYTNIKAKPFLVFLAMIGIILLITTYVMITNDGHFYSSDEQQQGLHNNNNNNPLVVEAVNRSSLPNVAFVFLAMGAQANQMNCPAAIESLVRYGGWNGHIYLITDQSNCFNPKEIISNAKITDPSTFHYLITKESFSKGGIDFQHPKVGFRQSRVRSFAMKTELFEFIPSSTGIDIIAYVDCDILFAKPSCPKQFIQSGLPWKQDMIKFSHVVADNTGYVTDLHAGSFVIHREYSAKILKEWKEQILSGSDEGDNNAFIRLYHKYDRLQNITSTKKSSTGSAEVFLPNEWTLSSLLLDMSKSSEQSSNWYEKFLDPIHMNTPQTISCMNHISKARCSNFGRNTVQQFVNQFHLKTYSNNKYQYCTNSLLQPLLYGWFPFGYLPFCPKMEMLL